MTSLKNTIVLITGAGLGIGAASTRGHLPARART